jgi:26S proteasome regulatory subunit N2
MTSSFSNSRFHQQLFKRAALTDVLKEGHIAGAGLGVYDIEPLPLDCPIKTLKNVTLCPYSADLFQGVP